MIEQIYAQTVGDYIPTIHQVHTGDIHEKEKDESNPAVHAVWTGLIEQILEFTLPVRNHCGSGAGGRRLWVHHCHKQNVLKLTQIAVINFVSVICFQIAEVVLVTCCINYAVNFVINLCEVVIVGT